MATNRKSPWLKETSEQSGFDNFSYDGKTWRKRWTGVKQNGLTIAPDEIDVPPPSSIPLTGSGISGTPRANSDTTTVPTGSVQQIQYVTASGGIRLLDQPWLIVVGSLQTINITANPQIARGVAEQVIAVQCVGSNIILENGSGLALIAGKPFNMSSGNICTLIYNATDNLWYETSRS